MQKHKGSCLCGDIQFEIDGDFNDFFFCHCAHCRKDTGSAHAANLFSSSATLKWIKGENKAVIYDHNSSGHIKSFCPKCGSALPNLQMEGSLLVVPAGSLDTDLYIKPTAHIYMAEKANWDEKLETAPLFSELPGE